MSPKQANPVPIPSLYSSLTKYNFDGRSLDVREKMAVSLPHCFYLMANPIVDDDLVDILAAQLLMKL